MNTHEYDLVLKDFLMSNFNLEEVKLMINEMKRYDSSADPDNFPGSKNMVILSVVQWLRRRGLTTNFVDVVDRYLSPQVDPMYIQIHNIAQQRGFK